MTRTRRQDCPSALHGLDTLHLGNRAVPFLYGSRHADDFSERYGDLLTGSYDCVDRIVLNAHFSLGHSPGGFRTWWRRLHGGSDQQLDNAHLMRMAGRFARRVRASAKANGIPGDRLRSG